MIARRLEEYLKEKTIGEIYPELAADERFKNSTIEKEIEDTTLWENALECEVININGGQQRGGIRLAEYALRGYHYLKSSGFWRKMKAQFKEKCERIEEGMKDKILLENAFKEFVKDIHQGQQPGETSSAWYAFLIYSSLLFLISELKKIGEEKEKQQAVERAIHPEENIPPRPRARSF